MAAYKCWDSEMERDMRDTSSYKNTHHLCVSQTMQDTDGHAGHTNFTATPKLKFPKSVEQVPRNSLDT